MPAIPIQPKSKQTAVFHFTTSFNNMFCLFSDVNFLSIVPVLKRFILNYSIWYRGNDVLAPELVKIICHSSSCNSSYSVLQMTGQTLMRKGTPSRDRCIQHLEGGQHNYVNTPTSDDPEQTPADANGRREDYSSYNQLLCPVNLPLTSSSLFNPLPTQPSLVHKTYDACFLPWAPIC